MSMPKADQKDRLAERARLFFERASRCRNNRFTPLGAKPQRQKREAGLVATAFIPIDHFPFHQGGQ